MKTSRLVALAISTILFSNVANAAGYTLTISPKKGDGKDVKVERFDDYNQCVAALKACKSKLDDKHMCWCK